jgi:hypothetical protein
MEIDVHNFLITNVCFDIEFKDQHRNMHKHIKSTNNLNFAFLNKQLKTLEILLNLICQ